MNDPTDGQIAAPLNLREDFPPPTLEAWHQECVRLLKGAPFERKMLTPTYEGITLAPLYTRADLEALAHVDSLPGAAPYLRGPRRRGYRDQAWQVAQELPYPTPAEFNEAVRRDLERGQSAAVVVVDLAGQAGCDPDQAPPDEVGARGTSVSSLAGLAEALDGVDLAHTPIHIEGGAGAVSYAAMLVALASEQGVDLGALQGSVGFDPVAGLAELGRLPLSLNRAYDELADLTAWAAEHAPGLQTLTARGHVYHDAGASAVQELAFTMSAAVHHLRELERRGVDLETAAPRLRCGFSVGTHFFMEIARLRAARLVWARIVEAAGGSEDTQRLTIHARTSRFTKTVLDPHVNILRATTEAMAAIFGQVDSLCVAPFDEPLGLPDRFSRRLARNTQLMLREESHLDLVGDPAGGSWFVESLTAAVAEQAWTLFQDLEGDGGIVAALQAGKVQAMIAATAAERRRNLAHRRDVLVGTNQYPNAREEPFVGRTGDEAALQELRAGVGRDEKLAIAVAGQGEAVFEAVVKAAAAGATVGQLSRALGHDADPKPTVTPLRSWRAGEMFERLRAAVRVHGDPRATTVFCACLGDVARYMPRLDFTRGFFQTGGFTVQADRFYASPEEVVEAAQLSGAASVVIVGLDDTYGAQAVEVARRLGAAGIGTVMVAGLPGDLVDDLREAGVEEFVHVRSDAHAVLSKLAASKGVAL